MPRQRIHLKTVGHVLTELCTIYRLAREKRMDWAHATSASLVLTRIRSTIETGDIEKRLEALEVRLNATQKPNGHGAHSGRRDAAESAH